MIVDKEQINLARKTDLHRFMLARHASLVQRVGTSICLKTNHSLYIKSGYNGFKDFATGETGNGIDFLIHHLGYSFQDAVLALADGHETVLADGHTSTVKPVPRRSIDLPEAAPLPHSRMYAYLLRRGIPLPIINRLARSGIAYQQEETGNIVFVTPEHDYCELRGTFTYTEKPFHGCRKVSADRFWYILDGTEKGKPKTTYITEAAIDAISLMVIQSTRHPTECAAFVSIGGVTNYAAIDRIARHIHTVLAVDNDAAGEACRERYPYLPHIIPVHKDWNEDLLSHVGPR